MLFGFSGESSASSNEKVILFLASVENDVPIAGALNTTSPEISRSEHVRNLLRFNEI